MKNLSIIGSTGSIGTQALEVADCFDDINIVGISAHSNVSLLEKQIRKYKPKLACIMDEKRYTELKNLVSDTDTRVVCGMEGMLDIASDYETDMLLTSVVGNVGLLPTVEAIKNKKKILLANKETLVTAGELIIPLSREYNVDILPVDSEHSAIFQCLRGNSYKSIKNILLTASGGPFYGKTKEELACVKKEDALKHPNWSMGSKITIDSATLMNKGLEVIEAKWLFDVDIDDVTVLVHRQSIIHSAVRFCDNSVIAQLGVPDMKLPISYAINYPDRVECDVLDSLDLFSCGALTFDKPDRANFPCLDIAVNASKKGGFAPTVMNAANEIAVELFLKDSISFNDIPEIVSSCVSGLKTEGELSVDNIVKYDLLAREYARELAK